MYFEGQTVTVRCTTNNGMEITWEPTDGVGETLLKVSAFTL